MENCRKFGYTGNLKDIVKEEVPNIVVKKDIEKFYKNVKVDVFTLWEDRPQLYIVTQMSKKENIHDNNK